MKNLFRFGSLLVVLLSAELSLAEDKVIFLKEFGEVKVEVTWNEEKKEGRVTMSGRYRRSDKFFTDSVPRLDSWILRDGIKDAVFGRASTDTSRLPAIIFLSKTGDTYGWPGERMNAPWGHAVFVGYPGKFEAIAPHPGDQTSFVGVEKYEDGSYGMSEQIIYTTLGSYNWDLGEILKPDAKVVRIDSLAGEYIHMIGKTRYSLTDNLFSHRRLAIWVQVTRGNRVENEVRIIDYSRARTRGRGGAPIQILKAELGQRIPEQIYIDEKGNLHIERRDKDGARDEMIYQFASKGKIPKSQTIRPRRIGLSSAECLLVSAGG